MKKLAVLFIIVVSSAMAPQVFAGDTDNFHRGFHEGLGNEAASVVVGVFARILSGDFNRDGYRGGQSQGQYRSSHIPPPRLMTPTGNAARRACSPRDKAYYRAKDRIYQQEYNRWVREQQQIGRAEGELEALQNVQRNRNSFFYRH